MLAADCDGMLENDVVLTERLVVVVDSGIFAEALSITTRQHPGYDVLVYLGFASHDQDRAFRDRAQPDLMDSREFSCPYRRECNSDLFGQSFCDDIGDALSRLFVDDRDGLTLSKVL